MSTALVLSGGDTGGDFEVGAVRCLYNRGIRPQLIAGSSVGAINAATLAQGDSGLDQLEQIWRSLREDSDMYLNEPWLDGLEPKLRNLFRLEIARLLIDAAWLTGHFLPSAVTFSAMRLPGFPLKVAAPPVPSL